MSWQRSKPKVSVVTALWNHKAFLPRRVDSILNQTLKEWEWIVVDDCSTDGSYEQIQAITQHDPRVRILRNSSNQGTTLTSQRGFDIACGEYLYRADDDDCCSYRFLERMTDLLDQNPTAGMAFCRGLTMDAKDGCWGGLPRRKGYFSKGDEIFERMLCRYFIKSTTIMFRKRIVDEVGGFALLPLLCNSDWHLSLRVCLASDVVSTDEPLAYRRLHGDNYSMGLARQLDAGQMEIEIFALIDEVLSRLPRTLLDRKEELRREAFRHREDGFDTLIRWGHSHGMSKQADELQQMVRKYVPDFTPSRSTPITDLVWKGFRDRLIAAVIKRITFRHLSPIHLTQTGQGLTPADPTS